MQISPAILQAMSSILFNAAININLYAASSFILIDDNICSGLLPHPNIFRQVQIGKLKRLNIPQPMKVRENYINCFDDLKKDSNFLPSVRKVPMRPKGKLNCRPKENNQSLIVLN